jgi:hypothetical protein
MLRKSTVALFAAATLLTTGIGCSGPALTTSSGRPAPSDTKARPSGGDVAPSILAASADGTIVADPGSESYRGYTSAGRLAWEDHEAYRREADVVCSARCPDAVFSAPPGEGAPDLAPWLRTGGGATPLQISQPAVRSVLTMRGPADAVVVEAARGGGDRIRLIRPDGKGTHLTIESAADLLWVENPAGSLALAVHEDASTAQGRKILSFERDRRGWRPAGRPMPGDGIWGACVAGHGEFVVLTGPEATLLVDGRPVPLRTDLRTVGECAAGATVSG